jgi:hypothetical protein
MSGMEPAAPNPPAAEAPSPREWAVFFGWIAGLVLIGGTVWFLTQPVRDRMLMNSVNRILARENGALLSAPLAAPLSSGRADPLGSWYGLENSNDVFFVFTLMRDGPLALWGARVSPGGKVEEILPLSGHARQIFADLPRGMLLTYIHRIEALGFPAEEKSDE